MTEYRSNREGAEIKVSEENSRPSPAEGNWHVLRGGSYLQPSKYQRAAWRNATPYRSHPFTSFRIARTLTPNPIEKKDNT